MASRPVRLLLGSLVAASALAGEARAEPNVLFIGVDDLRCNLGAYGDPVARTPNIDRLAARGTVFTRAYVQQAVCSASRASLLTGVRPDTTTVDYPYNDYFTQRFLPEHPSLPRYFADRGYEARAGGKIHHGAALDLKGLAFDRQEWYRDFHFGEAGERVPVPLGELLKDRERRQEAVRRGLTSDYAVFEHAMLDADGDPKTRPPAYEAADVAETDYRDGRLAEAVAEQLRGLSGAGAARPFFYAPGFVRPHLPFNAPQRYWDLYDPAAFTLPEANRLLRDPALVGLANASFELPSYDGGQIDFADDDRLRTLTHGYYAATSFTDANVGRVLDALDASGRAGETIIVLWSDHGFHLGENQSFGKHTNFEAAVRVPLIVVAPGFAAGQRCDALVEYVDLFPTLCDLAGVPAPAYVEGRSLRPLLEDPGAAWDDAAYSQWPRNKRVEGYSVRGARYRYTEWRTAEGGVRARELYDHETDPGESTNLAGERPEAEREMAALLHRQWPPQR